MSAGKKEARKKGGGVAYHSLCIEIGPTLSNYRQDWQAVRPPRLFGDLRFAPVSVDRVWDLIETTPILCGACRPSQPTGSAYSAACCYNVVGLRSCSHSAVAFCSNWACSHSGQEIAQVSE